MKPQASGASSGSQAQCLCGNEDRLKRVLMVRRLHPAVTMQMLLQTFGVFGSVTGCKVFTHKSGRSAGCASLEFSSHQAACAALKGLQGTLLHGKHVMLQWFDQTLSTATSPVGRGPGQRAELPAGALSEGGSCAAIAGRQLPPGANNSAGPVRSTAASCPGLSPFGMFAAAPPGAHPFCNNTAAMAAAAAAAAAVAAQQQQLQGHHSDAAAATAAALLSGQHHLPPLVVQQLQRQVSAPLGAFGQLSPTGAHIPASPLTPGSHGGGWEALMSPAGPHCGQQQPFTPQHHHQHHHHQQRDSAASSRGGTAEQQQAWSAAAAAVKLSAAMATGSIGGASQEDIHMAASLQQLANMQQQALAYAAWQNQQQAAAVLLQQQLSGQLPASPMLGGSAHMHLLSARSMPNDLGASLSAEYLLQQATASFQQQQQGMDGSEGGSSSRNACFAAGVAAAAAGCLSRQHSTPAGAGGQLLSAGAAAAAAAAAALAQTGSSGGADSVPGAAGAGSSVDQATGGSGRVRSPGGSARRRSTGALQCGGPDGKGPVSAEPGQQHAAKKHLQWEDQRAGASGSGDGSKHAGGAAAAAGVKGAGGGAEGGGGGGRLSRRSSSHQLLSPLRGYSGSDDTAHAAPDVDELASAQQQQQAAAAAAAAAVAASSCYLSSPTWLTSQRQGLSASQVTPELLATLQGPSLGRPGSFDSRSALQRSPSAAAMLQTQQQQQGLLLAAAAAPAGVGSPGSFRAASGFDQQQQAGQVSDTQLLTGGRSGGGGAAGSSLSQPGGMLFSSASQPGSSSVSAALDAMSIAAATSAAQGWQQQQRGTSAAHADEAPASDAFKHQHKMHLQLPAEGASAAAAAAAGKAGRPGIASGDAREQQLITTEVLPESPAVQRQQQQNAAHSPFGGAAGAAGGGGGGGDTGSAWADWSASMAALLSPAHVSSLASRRFEDLITLQHGMAQEAAAAAAAQGQAQQQQQQEQQRAGGSQAGVSGAGRLGSTSSQAAWLLQQGRGDQQQQQQSGFAAAASVRPGSLLPSAGGDVFAAAAGTDGGAAEGGAGGSLLGKTRHNSLCLNSRPGLLTLSHMFQEAAAQQGAARHSPRGPRAGSPLQQQQQVLQRRLAPADAEPSAGAGGSSGFGSFTFQPPVLRSLQASGLSAGSSSSSSSHLMICQPFQLPDFFSRDSRYSSCTSPRGSVSTPGGPSAARRDGGECVGSPLHPSGMQHQYSENLSGTCIAEESFSGDLGGTDRAPGSPCGGPRHLQHSFSMPARFSAPGGVGDALAAAAAAASGAGGAGLQQQEGPLQQQQQGERGAHAPYGEVFQTIWGPSGGSPGSLRG